MPILGFNVLSSLNAVVVGPWQVMKYLLWSGCISVMKSHLWRSWNGRVGSKSWLFSSIHTKAGCSWGDQKSVDIYNVGFSNRWICSWVRVFISAKARNTNTNTCSRAQVCISRGKKWVEEDRGVQIQMGRERWGWGEACSRTWEWFDCFIGLTTKGHQDCSMFVAKTSK